MDDHDLEDVTAALRAHLGHVWPDRQKREFVWTAGPAHMALPRLRVCRLAPPTPGEAWIYASLGLWEVTVEAERAVEFFIISRAEDPIHVETLFMLAHAQATGLYHLNLGATVNLGRGWVDGSPLTYLMASIPYLHGPQLEWCHIRADLHIRFLWLVPLHEVERDFIRQHGHEALEARLEQHGIDPTDPVRAAVV